MRLETRQPVDGPERETISGLMAEADEAVRLGTKGGAARAVALVDDALTRAAAAAAGELSVWVSQPTAIHDEVARRVGLRQGRDIFQMRRPLPADDPPVGFTTRAFRVGEDERAWLDVNNRAFAGHHDQSAWDEELLRTRMAEPWFDPDGFRLHERDGRLAGFCWTKVHADHEPLLGEIHVIAVDPDFAGLGLGRALTLAGLRWLSDQGLAVAMLYVDASNAPALALYRKLGFTVDHVDRGYYPTDAPAP